MSYKKWTSKLIVALLCYVATPAWAAQAPITVEANYLHYNDETGEIGASGNVKMNQEATQILTQQLTGNVQTGDMLANGQVVWTEANNTLTGEQLNYNYKTKEGEMGKSKGNMDGQLVTAESTIFHPENSVSFKATVTKCPAQVPDYKMTAEKVVIYPGEKLVAYNVAFWIKNIKLFSMDKFVKRLDEKDRDSSLPKIGYRSDDGFFIKQRLEYPLNDRLSGIVDLAYFTKRGMKNQFGLIQDYQHATLSVLSGNMQNSDGEWYKREPEITYTRHSRPIPDTRLNYGYELKAARIIEETTSQDMWYEKALLWVNRNPIQLGKNTTLYTGISYENYWYDNDTQRGIFGVSTVVNHQFNNRISLGVGYHYAHENRQSPFVYDTIDVTRDLRTEFGWQVDRLWYIGVKTSYDLDQSNFHDIDYTIKRNLHCFETEIVYREKRDEWQFRLHAIHW